ncbi:MAG: DHH family phosphoesterase [Spirochaetes bacterium]|nr:DHH family phosphoesterase [Spirochaetota bacterium]
MIKHLISAMEHAVIALKKNTSRNITLFHHNDTDGLSSATIVMSAFNQIGYDVSRFSLEKPYPQILKRILSQENQIIIFTDFAGRIAPMIAKLNNGKNLIIILDHHPAEAVDDVNVFNLDAELYGLKGDRDISASSTCYLFSDVLLRSFGLSGVRYSHLGALGAIGDGFLVKGALSGINREILNIAVNQGLIRVSTTDTGESYSIILGEKEYSADKICNVLDTVGGVGYYNDGTSRGIEICQTGLNPEINAYSRELERKKAAIFSKEIKNLKKNIHTTANIQWFNVEDRFQPMGIKMIGVFCSLIKDRDFLEKKKYLAGFQHVPDSVPGFGKIEFNSTKISMRVSITLTDLIRSGKIPGLNSFLPKATENLGGFSDACHRLSAATTVKVGEEELLIEEMEKVLKQRMENNEHR